MTRNVNGVYTLPPGINPVVPDTLIDTNWANPTMTDIANAITESLDRNGRGAMLAPLILSSNPIVQPFQATTKAYVDTFLAYATGMPIAAITAYASNTVPQGWLLCDGQAVGRTAYPELFAAIGTIYGAGDGTTTFNVPDLRNEFIRGLGGNRTLGSKQAGSFAAHTHAVAITSGNVSADHTHGFNVNTGGANTAAGQAHAHGVTDTGHTHSGAVSGNPVGFEPGPYPAALIGANTGVSGTGISIATTNTDHAHNVAGNTGGISANHTHDVNGATVSAGGSETVPQNMALNYYIKAIKDSTAVTAPVLAIVSSDPQMISIDDTSPETPVIQPQANVPFGIPKLDANGKVPLAQIPNSVQNNLGYFSAASGSLPAGTFASGDQFIISVGGTLNLYDPATLIQSPTVVTPGQAIVYITNSPTNPTGWYSAVVGGVVTAAEVTFTPVGDITSTNVQAAIAELDADVVLKVSKTSNTGSALLPAGTDAQRDAVPATGAIRFSSTNTGWEGWNGTNWVSIGGGQMLGQAVVKGIFYNAQSIAEDVTIAAGTNGLSAGPIEVANGFTVTVSAGSTWSVT